MMEFKSSVDEIEAFLNSNIFYDMQNEFNSWLNGARERFETTTSINEIWRCQGRIQVMKDVLLWAVNFKDVLEELEKEK